jgi:hypothetical protein
MRSSALQAMVVFGICVANSVGAGTQSPCTAVSSRFPPPQLEMRVPFAPSAFPSADSIYLLYELHLRNFEAGPIALRRVEVFDADAKSMEPVATFEEAQLDSILQLIGVRPSTDAPGDRSLAGGGSAVLFMSVAFEAAARVPNRLRHRVLTTDSAIEGAEIGTHHSQLRTFGPPLTGSDWVARSGPGNESYHRRGVLVFDGTATIDRRYAIDWVRVRNDATFSGDDLENRSYYAHGADVLAVADGRVVAARDGIPENVPRHEGFRPAVPISLETLAGNTITLDVGGGQFAYYAHLQPATLRVKIGDRVRRGQKLARLGNSGDSREPHLHFQVTTSSTLLAGEGLPYLIDRYRIKSAGGAWIVRSRELPLQDMVIDFGNRRRSR